MTARCGKERYMNDLISRQEVIDLLRDEYNWDECGQYIIPDGQYVIPDIMKLPSAQPEPTLEQIEEYCRKRCLVILTSEFYNEIRSRQPTQTNAESNTETAQDCSGCRHERFGNTVCDRCSRFYVDRWEEEYHE